MEAAATNLKSGVGGAGSHRRVGLFGNFGTGNLGNEATLEAALAGVRKFTGANDLVCICSNPQEVAATYRLPVVPIRWKSGEGSPDIRNRWLRLPVKLLMRIPQEMKLLIRAYQTLRRLDMLIVAGTGILDDFAIRAQDLPYDLFKWSILAWVCRVKLVFLSVGAGPLDHRLSRIFVRWSLRGAAYRSYRDQFSRDYLASIGFTDERDVIAPDLAFGLPTGELPLRASALGTRPVVGIGVMSYYGVRGDPVVGELIYNTYMAKLAEFGAWLVENDYEVRLLLGDTGVDQRAMQDFRMHLSALVGRDDAIVVVPLWTVAQLLEQIALTDVVVATRFHNILLSLLLERPAISISYNEKNDDLMREMGLAKFCQPIEDLNVATLIEQFTELVGALAPYRDRVSSMANNYAQQLEEQYAQVFS
ncbi:MAG: polysaccharide pyruvyl transferase family protein [Anaerolineales bacterium]|nr:polysaccharide pyruvyl transferase family protein [Anaerolineales bacterium]